MTSLVINGRTPVDSNATIMRDPIAPPYCPECGQPLDFSRPPTPGPAPAPRWLGMLLLVVGFVVGLVYVPQAWVGYESVRGIQLQVALAKRPCVAAGSGHADCTAVESALAAGPIYERLGVARDRLNRALVAVTVAATLAATGLGLASRAPAAPRPQTQGKKAKASRVLAAPITVAKILLGLVEILSRSFLVLVVVLATANCLTLVIGGATPDLPLVAHAFELTFQNVVGMVLLLSSSTGTATSLLP